MIGLCCAWCAFIVMHMHMHMNKKLNRQPWKWWSIKRAGKSKSERLFDGGDVGDGGGGIAHVCNLRWLRNEEEAEEDMNLCALVLRQYKKVWFEDIRSKKDSIHNFEFFFIKSINFYLGIHKILPPT